MTRLFPMAASGLIALAALTAFGPAATAATTNLTCSKAETKFLKPAEGSMAVPMTVYTGCKGYTEVALVLDPSAKTRPSGSMSFVRYCGSAVSPVEAKPRTDVWAYCSNALKASGDEGFWIVVK